MHPAATLPAGENNAWLGGLEPVQIRVQDPGFRFIRNRPQRKPQTGPAFLQCDFSRDFRVSRPWCTATRSNQKALAIQFDEIDRV
ncbi:MAG: hypothetical protein DMG70_30665 [Acidobacteria bacterium]|nr:MAG: hypothetical protein DMG70_30665 [Acidobacteriota bacterium]PYY06250.1 MAG: hypothetical protein DMG69_24015 [Acidobacteriota bacterium]